MLLVLLASVSASQALAFQMGHHTHPACMRVLNDSKHDPHRHLILYINK